MSFSCNICKSVKKEYVYRKVRGFDTPKNYDLIKCKVCQTVQTFPIPTKQQLSEYYGDQAIAYNGTGGDVFVKNYINNKVGHWNKLKLHKRLNEIKKYAPGAKSVLDVGCGAGLFIDYLRYNDYKVQGIELSQWGHAVAIKELRLKVQNKQLMEAGFKPKTLDVVTMYDLLEHTINPQQEVKYIHNLLKDDGVLIINVPNFDSFISRKMGSQWNKLIPPNHLYHFTIESLSEILKNGGFKIVFVTTNNGDAREFSGELFISLFAKIIGLISPGVRKTYSLRHTKNERDSIVHFKLLRASEKLGQALWFLSVPLMLLLNIIKKGEGIHIVAKKP